VKVDVHRPGVDPLPTGRVASIQLQREFVRSPQVVIIEEGDPFSTRLLDPTVPGGAHSLRGLVADQSDPRVRDSGDDPRCLVARSVIDDDDLFVCAALPKRSTERQSEKRAPVARRNNNRYARLHLLRDSKEEV
jgi:hypothetical protein